LFLLPHTQHSCFQFIKTPKFLAMRNWVEESDPNEDNIRMLPSSPPGLAEETGGAYITISQQASEREHRQLLPSAPGSP
jgi:hypothetical protein